MAEASKVVDLTLESWFESIGDDFGRLAQPLRVPFRYPVSLSSADCPISILCTTLHHIRCQIHCLVLALLLE